MTISLNIADLLVSSLAPFQPELPRMILESFADPSAAEAAEGDRALRACQDSIFV